MSGVHARELCWALPRSSHFLHGGHRSSSPATYRTRHWCFSPGDTGEQWECDGCTGPGTCQRSRARCQGQSWWQSHRVSWEERVARLGPLQAGQHGWICRPSCLPLEHPVGSQSQPAPAPAEEKEEDGGTSVVMMLVFPRKHCVG